MSRPMWQKNRRSEVFRATFLQRFEDDDDAAVIVAAGDVLYRALLEAARPVPDLAPGEDSATYREVLAIATDLRIEEEQLRVAGRGRTAHSLNKADATLATQAGLCAKRVQAAMRDLEEALKAHRMERALPGRRGSAGRRKAGEGEPN